MKFNQSIFLFAMALVNCFTIRAQDCVDSTLINPDAICITLYQPVCGCNGVTYSNSCEAINMGGVTSWTDGPCNTSSCIDMSALDFGLCDMFLGYAWNGSSCVGMSGCGYVIGNIDYSPNFYDNIVECAAVCVGDCISQYQIEAGYTVDCGDIAPPMCGCDGITYNGECSAYYYGGVTTMSIGVCGGANNYCPRIPFFVSFGDCDLNLGWALTTSGCIETSGCSYIGNNGHDYSAFFFESSYECGNQCIDSVVIECVDSTIINPGTLCPDIYFPVCGCDNVTYFNSCDAIYHHGITSFTEGECLSSIVGEFSKSKLGLKVYPNPAEEYIILQQVSERSGSASIYDITGNKMIDEVRVLQTTQSIQVSDLSPGLYFIRYTNSNGQTEMIPFVKQ
jgi:Secretion system C-terminal sorting domain/Kazal-type serine protease inhibitor domain